MLPEDCETLMYIYKVILLPIEPHPRDHWINMNPGHLLENIAHASEARYVHCGLALHCKEIVRD